MLEKSAWKLNGFLGLFLVLLIFVASIFLFALEWFFLGALFCFMSIFMLTWITVVQPNQAKVVTFFGNYIGTVRESGIWMICPLAGRTRVSLRVSNFNSATLKVNDVEGNPVEIAAVIVYRVVDTAKALFDVSNYEQFVEIQSETALRHIATKYPYDDFGEGRHSLRGNPDEVAAELSGELQSRLALAGVEVLEARLTHLAYATEIASAMLQRQQASAILAARQKIVEGAVGMAQMALAKLQEEGTVQLDDQHKMAMINNLLVAIISERGAQPVLNTTSQP